jgi:hypothetical protein
MFSSNREKVDQESIVQICEPVDLDYWKYVEEANVYFDLPMMWIEAGKEFNEYECDIRDEFKIPHYVSIDELMATGISLYEESHESISQSIDDYEYEWYTDNEDQYPTKISMIDEILLEELPVEKEEFIQNENYINREPNIFFQVREADGEDEISPFGYTLIVASLLGIYIVFSIFHYAITLILGD